MLRKLHVPLCALAFSLCLLLAGCATSSYEGAWYCVKNSGELETLTLDKNGSCYYSNGYSFEWKEIEGGIAVVGGLGGDTFLQNDDGSLSKVTDYDEQTYYKDQNHAQEVFDSKVAEANEQKDAYIEAATSQLVGTWYGESEPPAYMKEKYPEIGNSTCTVTFEADGTLTCSKTTYEEAYVSVFERKLEETSSEESGTWSIEYAPLENNRTIFALSNVRPLVKMTDDRGQTYAGPQIGLEEDGSNVSVSYPMNLEKR